jgi:hypothetical protein
MTQDLSEVRSRSLGTAPTGAVSLNRRSVLMNMMTTIAAPTIAVAAPSIATAMPARGGVFQVIELLAPPQNFELWGALAMDGRGQRWIVSAKQDGEITLACWEDRAHPGRDGICGWIPESSPPAELQAAFREALLDCPVARTRRAIESKPDPVFAAIERHRAAWLEYDASVDDLNAREEALPREFIARPSTAVPKIIGQHESNLQIVTHEDGVGQTRKFMKAEEVFANLEKLAIFRAFTNKQIDMCMRGPACEQARETARRQLRSAQRRYRAARKAAGIKEAQQRQANAMAQEADALQALALTIPTTSDGARRLIKYWCNHQVENLRCADESDDHKQTLRLLTSLWSGIGTIADMGREVPPAIPQA